MLRAYRTVPEGLIWVDRLADCDATILEMLGRRIGDDEPEVSLLAFQLAARDGGFSGDVARLLVATGRAEDALAYVEQARAERPNDLRLTGHEGRVRVALHQSAAAIPLLEEAARRFPNFRADLVRAHGLVDADAARETVHRFRLMGDTSPELGLAEAEVELGLGRYRACEAAIRDSGALSHPATARRAAEVRTACTR
jgi:tetratricopeptide (TPR) repeat protein